VTAVRRARPEDWPGIRDIRLRALRDAPSAFSATYEAASGLAPSDWRGWTTGEGWSGQVATFVAERILDTTAAPAAPTVFDAMATGVVFESEPAIGHLFAMWVDPSVRGTGVAQELVQAVVEWARDRGVDELRVSVTDGNGRAEALYTHAGFVRTGDDSSPLREGSALAMFGMRLPLEPTQ
jgi:GNAT superfamily N-acetyltransferase